MINPQPRRSGNVLVYVGEHASSVLSKAPVWREYKDPAELEVLKENGATDEWLTTHIIDELANGDVWYAFVEERGQPLSEFMLVAAEILIFTTRFPGYLTLVDGDVVSATILAPQILLSTSDDLDDENMEALEALAKILDRSPRDLLPVRYEVDPKCLNGRVASGVLPIALPSASITAEGRPR